MRRSIFVVLILTACTVLASMALSATPGDPGSAVRIEPSDTWVGLAKVHLELSDMWLSGGELRGNYAIRVPLRPSKNDTGTIRLRSSGPLATNWTHSSPAGAASGK